jgi:hypothetical protein
MLKLSIMSAPEGRMSERNGLLYLDVYVYLE